MSRHSHRRVVKCHGAEISTQRAQVAGGAPGARRFNVVEGKILKAVNIIVKGHKTSGLIYRG